MALPDIEIITDPDDDRFAYVRGCSHPKVPRDIRSIIGRPPINAEFLDDVNEWRMPLASVSWMIGDLDREGWTYRYRDRSHRPEARGLPECTACGTPYRRGTTRVCCSNCNLELLLVEPHACGPDCDLEHERHREDRAS